MAFALEGFQTRVQNHISKQISSSFYQKSTFLAVLAAQTLNQTKRDTLSIGRPDGGEILSGGEVSSVERKSLGDVKAYVPRIQGFKTNNTAARSGTGRVALPTTASGSTNSHGQATQFGAEFHWTHIDTPIQIWHEDKYQAARAGTKEGQAIAMAQVLDEAERVARQDHLDWLAQNVWTGSPTTQSDHLWDAPAGIVDALSTTNTYGRTDRSTLSSDSSWKSQLVSTATAADITKIIETANLDYGIATKGNGINLVLTTPALYKQFKNQILSSSGGGVVMQNGLPDMAKMGVRKEILQKDNVLITYDPFCPASTVCCFDTTVWKFMLHPLFNFKVTEFVDNTKTGQGQDAYDYAYIQTRFMLTCDSPFFNIRFSSVA